MNIFSKRVLPTNEDVMKHSLCIRQKEKTEINKTLANKDTADVSGLRDKLCIPTIRKDKILLKILRIFDEYSALLKDFNRKSSSREKNFKLKKDKFKREYNLTLFDIAYCKCVAGSRCMCREEMKVPGIHKKLFA